MKKQKKRAARKRMEKRRERRRKRHQPAVVPPGGAPELHGTLRTWVTDPLAMAVSGRILVLTLVKTRPSTWLVVTRASLLAGGYLETFDVRMGKESLPEEATHALMANIARPWGVPMRPAPVPLASRLVWGAMAYSMSRGVIASPEDGAMPALGYLPPPPGNPAAWCADFVRRFEEDQIAIADVVADQLREAREAGGDDDLASVPWFWIEIHLDTESPLSTWAEIDRHPAEFSYVETSHQRGIYRWRSRRASSRLLEPETMPSHGVVGLSSSGRIDVMALDVTCATAIVARLQELAPSLRLRSCHWIEDGEDLVEERRDLLEVGPLAQAVWPPIPRQAVR